LSRRNKLFLTGILFVCFVLSLSALAFAQTADIKGHWAEKQISEWVSSGFIKGYNDGTFRPDQSITRAEFITLTNRAFGFTTVTTAVYSDVKASDWFAGEMAKARAAGYISGYEDGTLRPNNNVTRQEVAAMIAKALKASAGDNVGEVAKFKDSASIPEWSRGFIGTVAKLGYMRGYPDGTFQPEKFITRAEAVVTLSHVNTTPAAVNAQTFDKPGPYGPETGLNTINGDAVISIAGVTLRNTVITGDLLLGAGIGDGDVTLRNVTVKGKTTVKGGGSHSINLENCNMPTLVVDKEGVRVVASGSTTVNVITLESGATLVEVSITGPGFETVTVSQTVPAGTPITLTGNFETVTVAAEVNVEITEGVVNTLNVGAAAQITGGATIVNASITAAGVTIQQTPTNTEVASGVTATVGGSEVTGTGKTPGGGGGGGGGTTASVTATAISASLTGAQSPVSGTLTNGVSGTIDLSDPIKFLDTAFITGIGITGAPAGSTLTTSSVVSTKLGTVSAVRTLSNISSIPVSSLLGGDNASVSLKSMRTLFGDSVTVIGTLACSGYTSSAVSLTISLGTSADDYTTDWATITKSGSTVTATITSGGTTIASIGPVDFLTKTAGQLPSEVTFDSVKYDPSVLNDRNNLVAAIAAEVGKPWASVTLNDVKVKGLQFTFKVSGDGTLYSLIFH